MSDEEVLTYDDVMSEINEEIKEIVKEGLPEGSVRYGPKINVREQEFLLNKCHKCKNEVKVPIDESRFKVMCVAITCFDGCCNHYCHAVGCNDHPLKNKRCVEHQDFGPETEFNYSSMMGGSYTSTAAELGWTED